MSKTLVGKYADKLEKENKHLNLQLDQALKDYEELIIKIDKANEILNLPIFEYDNCPDNVINEIIELKKILGDKENE